MWLLWSLVLGCQIEAQSLKTEKLELLEINIPLANVIEIPDALEKGYYVATLNGELYFIVQNKVTKFLDISAKTMTGSERGLLGFALHPDFKRSGQAGFGKFYVHYSHAKLDAGEHDHVAVISEFSIKGQNFSMADPSSERELIRILQPESNHNGGALEFNPQDKHLYIALGDGGAAHDLGSLHTPKIGNAQDKTNWLGKILRIDPIGSPYKIPASNPFAFSKGSEKKEIYAWGLRNVYRFNFDQGQLWAGDVGQHRWEEVNLVESGKNYGWGFFEGQVAAERLRATEPIDHVAPKIVYPNPSKGRSVIGGQVYRGKKFPKLTGQYIFGDFYIDHLYVADEKGFRELKHLKVGQQLTDVARDAEGNLYFTTLGGSIFRL